jgi:predicted amino acid-binding ACT domain protein
MAFEISRAEVWAGDVADRPGALAEKLEALERAGANLEFVIVRPSAGIPGTGVIFIAPLHGAAQHQAAEDVGLRQSGGMHVLRIVGPDRPGLGAGISRTLAKNGLNISGLSAAAVGDHCVLYIRLASEEDVRKAAQLLTGALGG